VRPVRPLLAALLFLPSLLPLVLPAHAGIAFGEFDPLVIDPRYGGNASWSFSITASGSFSLSQVSLSPVEVNRLIPYDGENLTSIRITPTKLDVGELQQGERKTGQFNVSLVDIVDPGFYQVRFVLSHYDQYGSFQSQTSWGTLKVSAVENPLELSMNITLSEKDRTLIVRLDRVNGTAVSLAVVEVCSYQRTWVLVNHGWTNSSGVAVVGLGAWADFGGRLTVFYTLRTYTCGGSAGAGPLHLGVEVTVPSTSFWRRLGLPWEWVLLGWVLVGTAVTATAFVLEFGRRKKLFSSQGHV